MWMQNRENMIRDQTPHSQPNFRLWKKLFNNKHNRQDKQRICKKIPSFKI